jgi:hypothetical protein
MDNTKVIEHLKKDMLEHKQACEEDRKLIEELGGSPDEEEDDEDKAEVPEEEPKDSGIVNDAQMFKKK